MRKLGLLRLTSVGVSLLLAFLTGCDFGGSSDDQTAEVACSNATCPPGTFMNMEAASGSGCSGGGSIQIQTAEGTVEAMCFSSGSCVYACVPPNKCCGNEAWTTTSYTCETPCCDDGNPPPCETACGNGLCDVGENPETCAVDCAVTKTSISGFVLDAISGAPISGAHVSTEPPTESVYTDESGNYVVTPGMDLAGYLRVNVSAMGYLPNYADIAVVSANNNAASVNLYAGTASNSCSPVCVAGSICDSGECYSMCGAGCAQNEVCNGEICISKAAVEGLVEGCGDGVCSIDKEPGTSCLLDCRPIWPIYTNTALGWENWDPPIDVSYNGNGELNSVQFIDFDADGDIDIVGFAEESKDVFRTPLLVYVRANLGNVQSGPVWDKPIYVGSVTDGVGSKLTIKFNSHCATLADIDNDGEWDIVMGPASTEDELGESLGIVVASQDASGDFILRDDLSTGLPDLDAYDLGVQVSDMTGDGLADLLFHNNAGIFSYVNIGSASQPLWSESLKWKPSCSASYFQSHVVALGDVSRDGRTDAVCLIRAHASEHLEVFVNTGSMFSTEPVVVPILGPLIADLADLVDVDGTGYLNVTTDWDIWDMDYFNDHAMWFSDLVL